MPAAMVCPEAKHGGDASAPAVDYPIADVVAITFDHRAAGAGPALPKLVTPTAVRALTNGPPEACSGGLFDGHGSKNVCARSLSRKRLESVVGQKLKSSMRAHVFRYSPTTDIANVLRHVRFVPRSDIGGDCCERISPGFEPETRQYPVFVFE
jgi:hypothetical protein